MTNEKSILKEKLINHMRLRLSSFSNTAFILVKTACTLLILWRLGYLVILLYFYIGNVIALNKAISHRNDKKTLRKMVYNPYTQYKLFFRLLDKERSYTSFAVGFWFLLLGASSVANENPLGFLLIILFITLWPSLVTTEWYYANRAKPTTNSKQWQLYMPLFLQVITLNLIGPYLQYRASLNHVSKREYE